MKLTTTMLIIGAAFTSINASAPAENSNVEPTPAAQENDVCLRNASISGFTTIDRKHILVTAATKSRTFLITTKSSCLGLDRSDAIRFSGVFAGCVSKNDRIYYSERVFNSPAPMTSNSNCYVQSIDQVADVESARALIAERAATEEATIEQTD